MTTRSDLLVAIEAADAADAVGMRYFRSRDLGVDVKPDDTPVSVADREAERAIRSVLAAKRPDDGVLGEEYGSDESSSRRWIVDPIDGTANYIRGVPVWGTLIGLEEDGVVDVGVVSAPALGMRWWAGRGLGAWRNAERIAVSSTRTIEEAFLCINTIVGHEQVGLGRQVLDLSRRCARTRGFGDFWMFMLLAEGAVDIVVEPVAAVWDLAPLQVIVEEAGGRFTDLSGAVRFDGGSAVATNGPLHDEVLAALR